MVYGKGCPGNYNGLVKIAKHSPIFPDIGNQRSMLHINNLSEFLRLVIIHQDSGIFFPQNEEYVNVSLMVKLIAKKYDKEITLFRCFNPIIKVLSHRVQLINKVFGTLVYEIELSNYKKKYNVCTFQESINN
jgi:UDP-glucose 4-epimerase